ncbi:hypothetical protein LZ318_14050 [Saccharopolyspora indica]|uniref:hypothetical protein n=1 Tax=Saccharopolyspora indica TaxID=1229659 RepID=UPI0022EB8E88|nr:hypothetical protein [Saccharopolyspora indica]MDA3646978.1 hypothetical protein [Saccharopolyspora indica]
MQNQDLRKVNHAALEMLRDRRRTHPIELTIDEFDQWTNPAGLRLGGTIWTKTDNVLEAA